jgi:hypothetical protein
MCEFGKVEPLMTLISVGPCKQSALATITTAYRKR